jgi:ABC-type nitrate/sulfonate/bicarbonate transport system substrate-binding protein
MCCKPMLRIVAISAALCTMSAIAPTTALATDTKIVIAAPGIPPIFASIILYVADKEGLFKKYGANVEIRPFDTGTAAARAIIAGDIEMAMSPSALIINQVSNTGVGLVAIYGLVNSDMVLASVDPTKTSCKDVVGQPVGVDTVGGARSIALRTMLAGGCPGVTIDQVQQVALSSNVGSAMIGGSLNFGVLHLDDVATVEAAGKKVNQILTISKTNPNGHYLVFVVRQDKLKANRDAYVRVMAALIDAARFIHDLKNADRVAADAIITGHTAAVSKEAIKPLLDIDYWPIDDDGLDQPRLDRLIALMKKVGGIKSEKEPVKYDRLVDQTVWHDAIELTKKH